MERVTASSGQRLQQWCEETDQGETSVERLLANAVVTMMVSDITSHFVLKLPLNHRFSLMKHGF